MPGGGSRVVKLEVGQRIAVLWDGDNCYYPAEVADFDEQARKCKLHYIDGDEEVLTLEDLFELLLIALPPDVISSCGGTREYGADSPVCHEDIDLSAKILRSSKHVVCSACSTAFHFDCAANLKIRLTDDKNRRPPRLTKGAIDMSWLAEWRCPHCELKTPVKKEERWAPANKSKAPKGSKAGARVSKSKARRSSASTEPSHRKAMSATPSFRGPEEHPSKPEYLIIHDVAPKFEDDLVQYVPACEQLVPAEPSSSLSFIFPSNWKPSLDALARRYALHRGSISSKVTPAVAYSNLVSGVDNTTHGEEFYTSSEGFDYEGSDAPSRRRPLSSRQGLDVDRNAAPRRNSDSVSSCDGSAEVGHGSQRFRGHDKHNPFNWNSTDLDAGDGREDVNRARDNKLDPPLSRRLPGHDSFSPEDDAAYFQGSRVGASESASEGKAPTGHPNERSGALQLNRRQNGCEENVGRSRKRPRSHHSSLHHREMDFAGAKNLDLAHDAEPPILRRKGAGGGFGAQQGERVCAFCRQTGDIPECEGDMLGPFTSRREWAHRNCLSWAPDTVEVIDVTETGKSVRKIERYGSVFPRSRKKLTGKCIHCDQLGASVSCMYMKTKCCRPMHFRCALLAGASILVSKGLEYLSFCPDHKEGPYDSEHVLHEAEHLFVQTPVTRDFFEKGKLCVKCGLSNFDTQTGPILDCADCGVRIHSQCALVDIETVEGAFAVDSHKGQFFCRDCAKCFHCGERLAICGGEGGGHPGSADASAIIACVGCKMPSGHASCLSSLSSKSRCTESRNDGHGDEDVVASTSFRCERCRRCNHCGVFRVPLESWNESIGACGDCAVRYESGAVCPICDKAYRDDDDNMILCDGCDKWLHGRDCCGLTEEEFIGMSDDVSFFCKKCKPPRKRSHGKSKKSSTANGFVSDEEVVDTVLEEGALVDADGTEAASNEEEVDYEEYIATHDFETEAKHDVSFTAMYRVNDEVPTDFVPHIDLCRRCGSGGPEEFLRFCADCGDALHVFCLDKVLPPRNSQYVFGNCADTALRRFSAGGLGSLVPPWRCKKCAICEVCEVGEGNSSQDTDIQELQSCDHCGNFAHASCVDRAVSPVVALTNRSFICSSCVFCELCLSSSNEVVVHDDHLFCALCWSIVTTSKPCSCCGVQYPAPPTKSTAMPTTAIDPLDTDVCIAALPSARKCYTCEGLVHRACDDTQEAPCSSYVCRKCDDGVGQQVSSLFEGGSRLVQTHEASNGVEEGLVSDLDLPVPPTGASSTRSSPSCPKVQQLPSQSPKIANSHPNHSAGGMTTDSKDVVVRTRTLPRVLNQSNPKHSRAGSLRYKQQQHEWTIGSVDDRTCELCKGKEEGDDDASDNGRLLPWMGSGSPLKVWWVHVACALWSSGVSRVLIDHEVKGLSTCFLVADRHYVAGKRSQRVCEVCEKPGATVHCGHEGCNALYHYQCAKKSGCRFQAKTTVGEDELRDVIELKQLSSVSGLTMTCKDHCGDGSETSTVADEAFVACTTLSTTRRLNFRVPIRFSRHRDVATTRDNSMLRTGGLIVFRFGHLVAHSSLFFEQNAIVPSLYRAGRRHWSLKHPGHRCTLLLDITGSARSGPVFSIRFSDDPEARIVASSASIAWEEVAAALEQTRLSSLGQEQTTGLSLVLSSGVSIFGLSDCDSAVSGIEALPHSFLLRGRHKFLHGDPIVPSDFPFPVPRMNWVGRENSSGSARLEGYVPRRHPLARISAEGAYYQNIPSGERFQLHVAMGLGDYLEHTEEDTGLKQIDRGSGERVERAAGGGIAVNLPHSMQHRAMLKTWKRRTVVLRSGIEGWGVFATEDIAAGDMVIEYMGQLIRPITSDEREAYYDSQGIGCYMFEVAPGKIVDATKTGNRARYINHSCDPNCYSRTVAVEHGRRVIVIFAKRDIKRGEELCYDYQFPLDAEDRVACACRAAKCKGFMN